MQISPSLKKGIEGIWRHFKPFKKQIFIISLLGVISAAANGAVPYVTGKLFDSLINLSRGEAADNLSVWVTFLVVWGIIQLVANNIDWIIDRLRRYTDVKLHLNIQVSGFTHLLMLPLSFHKDAHIQDMIHRISVAGWRISSILRNLTELAPQLLSVIIGLILALTINTTLALILVAGVVLYMVIISRVLPNLARIDERSHKLWVKGWDISAAPITQIESVKQAAAEAFETERINDHLLKKVLNTRYKMEVIWSNINFFQRVIVFLTQLSIFIFSVAFITKGIISVGELIALNGYAVMFFGPFVSLGHSWQIFQNGLTSAAHVEDVFRTKPEAYRPTGAVSKEIVGLVTFENVSFQYSDTETVLHDVSFHVSKGERIALVGESGAGKSTLISLLSGYHFPQQGRVIIDDVPTTAYDLTNLRSQIAVVPQEIALFNDTIEYNIRYGNFDAPLEAVKEAARTAHLDSFIVGLKDGYQALVGERGVKLSGGQKQRLAIARAILRNPKILILDEPTSALDAITEKGVTESLEYLMEGRTTFIIAHRLSTVRKADRILVFDQGKIVEQGTHTELLKAEGLYKRLHDYQIGIH